MDSWDINTASGGRFNLGLGSQIKQHNERRFGVPWSSPVPRMRDYVGAVRALWRFREKKEPLNYVSDTYRIADDAAFHAGTQWFPPAAGFGRGRRSGDAASRRRDR